MTIPALIARLSRQGVSLSARGDQLAVKPGASAIDPGLLSELKERKAEVLEFIQRRDAAAKRPPLVAVPDKEALPDGVPLTPAQSRLWFIDQLRQGETPEFNVPEALTLNGALDTDALAQALSAVVARHEILRTHYLMVDGASRQKVRDPVPVPLPVQDITDLTEAEQTSAVEQAVTGEWRRPFDLANGPVLRARLLRLKLDRHVLLVTVHHIAFDGWSSGVFFRELSAFYDAAVAGGAAGISPLELQVSDVALWCQKLEKLGAWQADLDWWLDALGDAPLTLALPTDRPRGNRPGLAAGTDHRNLSPDVLARLDQLARTNRASLFHVLMSAFAVVLQRQTGMSDIVIGTPVAGRDHTALEPMIGFFVNSLPLRIRIAPDDSFETLLQRTRDVALDAQTHQSLPFERLVQTLCPERDLARPPVFQAQLTLQNTGSNNLRLGNLDVERVGLGSPLSRFDISLHVKHTEDGLLIGAIWPEDLFDNDRMSHLLDEFCRLLDVAAQAPERPLHCIDLTWVGAVAALTGPEQKAAPSSLTQMFCNALAATSGAAAIRFKQRSLSNADLLSGSGHLAAKLVDLGAGMDKVVAIALTDPVEMVTAMLAVLRSGAAFLFLNPDDPLTMRRDLLDEAAAVLLICSPDTAMDTDVSILDFDQTMTEPWLPALYVDILPDAAAYVVFTSGSTGRRKGVVVPHRAAVTYVTWLMDACALTPDDCAALVTAPSFDLGLTCVFGALASGGSLFLPDEIERRDMALLFQAMRDSGVTWFKTTPSWLRNAVGDPAFAKLKRTGLRAVMTGGEPQIPEALQACRRHLPQLVQTSSYGPTEATISCFSGILDPDDRHSLTSLGDPLPNVTAYVLDDQLTRVGFGTLWIGGPGVARGYLGRPGLTAGVFVADPFGPPGARMYCTGDLVRQRADGTLAYVGRADRQLKIRGHRVEPGELEAALLRLEGVAQAVAAPFEAAGERRLGAWIVPLDGADAAFPDGVRAALGGVLPAALVPSALVVVDAIPLTANGKVDLAALPDPQLQGGGSSRAPETDGERLLCALFAELTGAENVGVDDDFFTLGGHSLLVMRLVARLRAELGVELPLAAVFDGPTPAGLARQVLTAVPGRPPLRALARDGFDRDGTGALRVSASHAQSRLWFIDQLEGGSVEYNMPEALRLRGPLNHAALHGALNAIVARHESLRTRFEAVDGVPVQVIAPELEIALPVTDLGDLTPAAQDAALAEVLALEWRTRFDLETGPLIRARLLRLGEADHVLVRTCHHIVSDGWSAGVLNRETAAYYGAFCAGEGADVADPMPPLSVQYADFAQWQRQWLDSGALDAGLAWWRRQLEGAPNRLTLPTDRPRPDVQTFSADLVRVTIDAGTTAVARALAAAGAGPTLFQVLLSAFAVVLSRDSRQDDIVIGTAIANRQDPQLDPLVGFFVNALALRVQVDETLTFAALLEEVKTRTLNAYQYQDVPFERLVEEIAPDRSLGHTPIFQVFFTLQNVRQDSHDLDGLRMDVVPGQNLQVRFDLEVHSVERDGEVDLFWLYNRDLFDAGRIQSMADRMVTLLRCALASPEEPVAFVDMLPNPVAEPAAVEEPAPDDLEAINDLYLPSGSRDVSSWIAGLGQSNDAPVLIVLDDPEQVCSCVLAALEAGQCFAVAPDTASSAKLLALVSTLNPAGIVTSASHVETGLRGLCRISPDGPGVPTFVWSTDHETKDGGNADLQVPDPNQLACLDILDGNAGELTCLPLARDALFRRVKAIAGLLPDDVAKVADLSVIPAKETAFWLACLAKGYALSWDASDTIGARISRLPGGKQADFDDAFDGLLQDQGNLGGFSIFASDGAGSSQPAQFDPCAGLVDVGSVRLLDGYLRAVPVGVLGEVWVRGAQLARGYAGQAGLTACSFVADPFGPPGTRMYRTGDLAAWTPDGRLIYGGRVDAQLQLRGHRIEPGEITSQLRRQPGVRDALVRVTGEGAAARLIAYVVTGEDGGNEGAGADARTTERHVARWQQLYDATYGDDTGDMSGDFDISGWNSSYDGKPIRPDMMRRWVDQTVTRIRSLCPAGRPRILEIGCGTGLLLTRLAPDAGRYTALDFSATALAQVQAHVDSRADLAHVTLHQGTADDLGVVAQNDYDIVIVNSVIQYFPDAAYLQAALTGALDRLRPGGALFVGDVRSRALLGALHASVLVGGSADPVGDAAGLRARLDTALRAEEELVLDPAFFDHFAAVTPGVAWAETAPKLGGYDNELSRFRFDAWVWKAGLEHHPGGADPGLTVPWDTDGAWRGSLDKALAKGTGPVTLADVPDPRAAAPIALETALRSNNPAAALADLPRTVIAGATPGEQEAPDALTADALTALAGDLPHRWTGAGTGRLSLTLRPRRTDATAALPPTDPTRLTNAPARRLDDATLVTGLLRHLQKTLPAYMVPATILPLSEWPTNNAGKVDINKLPVPDDAVAVDDEGDVTTTMERIVKDHFAQVFGRTGFPLDEDFFEAGGHSLMAMRLVTALGESLAVDIPIGVLWEYRTARKLSGWLDCAKDMSLASQERRVTVLSQGAQQVFVFPPALGFSLAYARLAKDLSGIGVNAFGAPTSLDQLAEDARIASEMQPEGAMWLLGHSSGGYLAWLTARHLEAMGREVAGVIVLDGYWYSMPDPNTTDAEIRENVDRFVGRAGRERIACVFGESRHFREQAYDQVIRYFRFLMDPALDTRTPISAPTHLILADGHHDREEDWSVRSGGCIVYPGYGQHAFMVDPPHSRRNAAILKKIMGS